MHLTERHARESGRYYALRTLKDNIIRLELKPGSMVSEKELADELGLSRGPVREAMIELAKVKIVEIYPQRGSAISLVDYDLVDEACFMRETLEAAVVERCCKRGAEPEHLDWLKENIKLQRFYLENQNYDKLLTLDDEFHRRLFLYANVMQIYNLMNSMLVHFDRVRAMALTAVKNIKIIEDHSLILDAMLKCDSKAAKQIMHTHLTRYQIDKEAIRKEYPQYMKH